MITTGWQMTHETDWFEDDWFNLGDKYDLNLWTDSDGHRHATLYLLKMGKCGMMTTDTENFLRLI